MNPKPSQKDIVKQIFLEEQYVDTNKTFKDSAVLIDTESFSDIITIKSILDKFYSMTPLEQQGYIKHLKTIIQTMELANVNMLIDKLFDRDFSPDFINSNTLLCILLLDAIDTILYMVFEDNRRIKAKTDMIAISRVSVMLEASMGILDQPVTYEQDVIHNSLLIEFCKCAFSSSKVTVKQKLVRVFEKVAKYSSQFERDQKILRFLSEELSTGDIPRIALALEIISTIAEYFTPALMEILLTKQVLGFIKASSSLVKEAAFSVFVRVVSILDSNTVTKNYSGVIKLMASDRDPDVNIVFISSFSIFIPKLPLTFIKSSLLPSYYAFQASNSLSVRIEFLASLSQVIIRLLVLIKKVVPIDVDMMQEAFRVYFNLVMYTEELKHAYRYHILNTNYKDLYAMFKIFGKGLWPYLKYLFGKLETYADNNIVEIVKLAMTGSVFKLGPVLGQELLEKEALTIIDSAFLILNGKTTINVKMKAMPLVYKLLREVTLEKRKFFADYYIMLQDDAKKWRIKAAICNQIEHLVKLFEINDVLSFILPLVVKLCKDECAVVRKSAAREFHWLFDAVVTKAPEFTFLLVDYVRSLAEDSLHQHRIAFIDITECLMEAVPCDTYTELRPILLKLISDKVSGVRIRLLGLCIDLYDRYEDKEFLEEVAKGLIGSKDKELNRRGEIFRGKVVRSGRNGL